MTEKKNAPAVWAHRRSKKRDEMEKHPVPILSHYPRRRKRKRIRLRATPLNLMIAAAALYVSIPLVEMAINAMGAIPSVAVLGGMMIILGVLV